MTPLPLFICLRNRRVLIVGGGSAARRKTKALLGAGARPIVVAPKVVKELEVLQREGKIRWWKRSFEAKDCRCCSLVVAATNDPKVNSLVGRAGRKNGALTVLCDKRKHQITFASTVRRGKITFAVSTAGTAPALARYLKNEVAKHFPNEWKKVGQVFFLLRQRIKKLELPEEKELKLWQEIFASQALTLLLKGSEERFEEEVARCISLS